MTLPAPRLPGDDVDPRQLWLNAAAYMWDHCRESGRAQLSHGGAMILAKLGGTLILRGQFQRRTLPEAGYISEGYGFADLGYRRLD